MCGIYFRYKGLCSTIPTRHEILKNRGPDNIKEIYEKNYCAIFYRLAIIGLDNGMQPFIDKTDKTDILLMCNGEIYNNKNLETKYNLSISSSSDCECIMDLYKKLGIERTVRLLDGEFAFVLYDIKNVSLL
jgi:asparagine synthase (glutamine-hydrolysing)